MRFPLILFLISCAFGILFMILIYYISYQLYLKEKVNNYLFGGVYRMFRDLKLYKEMTANALGRIGLAYYFCYIFLGVAIFSFIASCCLFIIRYGR